MICRERHDDRDDFLEESFKTHCPSIDNARLINPVYIEQRVFWALCKQQPDIQGVWNHLSVEIEGESNPGSLSTSLHDASRHCMRLTVK